MMNANDVSSYRNQPNLKAEIISYADNRRYLAALVNCDTGRCNLITLDDGSLLAFKGLGEAKGWFKHRGYKRVTLRMDTPYDEFHTSTTGSGELEIPLSSH